MKNISFSLTKPQVLNQTKDVTRRLGWFDLIPGQQLRGIEKGMGLKKGEKIKPLCIITIVSVRREKLRTLTDDLEYGISEVRREGFADHRWLYHPSAWVPWFCSTHDKCTPESMVTRIEFKVTELLSTGARNGR
jgi:hypothetical protein